MFEVIGCGGDAAVRRVGSLLWRNQTLRTLNPITGIIGVHNVLSEARLQNRLDDIHPDLRKKLLYNQMQSRSFCLALRDYRILISGSYPVDG
jgi:hypothetical protein